MSTADTSPTITVHVAMKFVVRGGRTTVIADHVPPSTPQRMDCAILKALARAHHWRRMIENGEYASITELARDENINQSYACRLLRLTLLAPAIVTTILNGRLTMDVTLKQLLKPLPVRWDKQAKLFDSDIT